MKAHFSNLVSLRTKVDRVVSQLRITDMLYYGSNFFVVDPGVWDGQLKQMDIAGEALHLLSARVLANHKALSGIASLASRQLFAYLTAQLEEYVTLYGQQVISAVSKSPENIDESKQTLKKLLTKIKDF